MSQDAGTGARPDLVLKAGPVKLAGWKRTSSVEGRQVISWSVNIDRVFLDPKTNTFKATSSLRGEVDLCRVLILVQEALRRIGLKSEDVSTTARA